MLSEIAIASVLCLLILLGRYYLRWWHFCRRVGVFGPIPFPFIGHVLQQAYPGLLFTDALMTKKYGRAVPLMTGWRPQLMVTDPAMLKQIMVRDFKSFTDRSSPALLPHPLSLNLLQLDGERWKRIRTIVTPTFTSGKLKHVFPMISFVTQEVVEKVEGAANASDYVNLTKLFGFFTASTISTLAFGLELNDCTVNDRRRLADLFEEVMSQPNNHNWRMIVRVFFPLLLSFKSRPDGTSIFPLIRNSSVKPLVALLDRVYQERLSGARRYDFFQMMLDARMKANTSSDSTAGSATSSEGEESDHCFSSSTERLSKDELFGQAGVFLFAGYDTTMTTLSFTSILLAQHQDVQEQCAQEIEEILSRDGNEKLSYEQIGKLHLLEAVLKESLRLYTPIRRFFRECTQDTNVSGVDVRRGDMILIPGHAIHRLPELWGSDAESFNPNRFLEQPHPDFSFQAFGMGQRSCIGERLAMIEAKAVLSGILPHYRFVPGHRSVIPPKLTTNTFLTRSPHDLLLKVEKRQSSLNQTV